MPTPHNIELKSRTEALFVHATEAQAAFWDALSSLEAEAGIEIDGTTDLSATSLTTLLSTR